MIKSVSPIVAVAVLLSGPHFVRADEVATPTSAVRLRLDGGATSIDTLLDAFQAAIDAKDERALHRLRVNQREYLEIIIPGTVKPGEPPRKVEPTPSMWFWQMLNQKSEDMGRHLIKVYGGHKTKRIAVKFTKGSREFGLYKAHGNVELTLQYETGEQQELRTGSIAEVNGRFKFIGFNQK